MDGQARAVPLVILGGTFDPVHYGHLRTALELQQCFGEAEVALMPAFRHRLREAGSSAPEHRLAMLERALEGVGGMQVEALELARGGVTYTVESLEILRRRHGASRSLAFVMGMDGWNSLPRWHRWLEIIHLAHIIVVARPGWSPTIDDTLGEFLHQHRTESIADLAEAASGRVIFLSVTQMDISSTRIRQMVGAGLSPRFLLPDAVFAYIQTQHLYGCHA